MKGEKRVANSIDEYIADFPTDIQEILQKIRRTIHEAAPEAKETIGYAMPTFTLYGNLVHFAAYKNHIGFYPTPSGVDEFKERLSVYKGGKGSVQFPLNQPMPYDLIKAMVLYRVAENTQKAEMKGKKKK